MALPEASGPMLRKKVARSPLLPQQGKKTGDAPLHPLIGVHIDFQSQDPCSIPLLINKLPSPVTDAIVYSRKDGSFSSRKE